MNMNAHRVGFSVGMVGVVLVLMSAATTAVGAATENGGPRMLIVDPACSESGDYCSAALSGIPGATLKKIDLTQIEQVRGQEWDAVVWVWPQPSFYKGAAAALWREVTSNKSAGVMILGLPQDDAGRAAVFDALSGRGQPKAGVHFGPQFSGCSWIWPTDSPKSDSRVYLRRKFEVQGKPKRAWLQVCGDNQATVWLNGKRLGQTENWQQPLTLDVLADLRDGANVIAIEGYNVDGYAGVLVSLVAIDDAGGKVAHVVSDKSWRGSETQTAGWNEPAGDDSSWQPAAELAIYGEGPWQAMVKDDSSVSEAQVTVAEKQSVFPGLKGNIGRATITDGLTGGANASVILSAGPIAVGLAGTGAGGRCIIISADAERASLKSADPDLLNADGLGKVLAQSAMWLAGREATLSTAAAPRTPATLPALSPIPSNAFPVAVEFSPLPREGVPTSSVVMRSPAVLRRAVDEIIDHGFTTLLSPVNLAPEALKFVEEYAQSRGMTITYNCFGGVELFGREAPPKISVYSPDYAPAVAELLAAHKPTMDRYTRLAYGFPYRDEPFHQGLASFDYSEDAKKEFAKRYGYAMPEDPQAAQADPKKWLDLLNFQSDSFADGWRQAYKLIKQAYPAMNVILTHDSHNTLGGGVGQEAVIAIDDVYHWGADFADTIVFDIYPYVMNDFRYGPNRELMKPRMSQMHFAMAQLRNLTSSKDKKLGYWFDCYNIKWFPGLNETMRGQYWLEREMAFTAVASGADYLLAAAGIPEDRKHWDDLKVGLQTIHKAGPALLRSPKLRARAAFVFPRTQYLQLQQEYWNVAQSFELFLRALGELDVIHEEQLTPDQLDRYKMLVLCDIELLPRYAAENIDAFVKKGGIVVADCVPRLDSYKAPLDTMPRLFGVDKPQGGRIIWPVSGDSAQTPLSDRVRGTALGIKLDLPILSTRSAELRGASVLLKTASGGPPPGTSPPPSGRAEIKGLF